MADNIVPEAYAFYNYSTVTFALTFHDWDTTTQSYVWESLNMPIADEHFVELKQVLAVADARLGQLIEQRFWPKFIRDLYRDAKLKHGTPLERAAEEIRRVHGHEEDD